MIQVSDLDEPHTDRFPFDGVLEGALVDVGPAYLDTRPPGFFEIHGGMVKASPVGQHDREELGGEMGFQIGALVGDFAVGGLMGFAFCFL